MKTQIRWSEITKSFSNRYGGKVNMGWLATSAHRKSLAYSKTALRFIQKNWPSKQSSFVDVTYKELDRQSHLFSLALQRLGINENEVLFTLAPKSPSLYSAIIGALKQGLVVSPLFSAFGSDPIKTRITKGEGRVLFTLASYYFRKIQPLIDQIPSLKYIIFINDTDSPVKIEKGIEFNQLLLMTEMSLPLNWQEDDSNFEFSSSFIKPTTVDSPALLHFTSGTTGQPKGAIHVHGAAIYHYYSGQVALDLKPSDTFWCTADPGWVTGMSYGILCPLFNGVTCVIDEGEFQADRWYRILQDFKVSVWYTAPTALRMLMKQGDDLPLNYKLESVRFAASVGEPLNPEVVIWARRILRINIHDNWWQTETGGIMIANLAKTKVKPGSMGKPLPGLNIKLIKSIDSHGHPHFVRHDNEQGEIAIHIGWPSMFRAYLQNQERYQKSFAGDWYLSGDLATVDKDGYFWFVGRKDDVIKSSGHLIGPFEIENIILEHPKVAEAGVIGKPDPIAGELVKAFVSLKEPFLPTEETRLEILAHTRSKLGPAVAPREISFLSSLPKTKSGKIMRRLLKARELGLPEGDTSTLESSL